MEFPAQSRCTSTPIGSRYVDTLRGYVPIGFFQLWHASAHKDYPLVLGTAQHDDVLFAEQWPRTHRAHLPTVITYHLCAQPPKLGENWTASASSRGWCEVILFIQQTYNP